MTAAVNQTSRLVFLLTTCELSYHIRSILTDAPLLSVILKCSFLSGRDNR